jgi:hypothetical protein
MDDNLTPTYGVKDRQRVEFSIAQINDQFWNGLGAPLPLPADNMVLSLGATTFQGDTDPCAFSADARPVAVWKRPMQQEDLTLAIGLTKSIPHNNDLASKILYHGAVDPAVGTPLYGNYTIPGTPDEGKAVASLVSGYKDVEEKFLDEVYRYYSQWTNCPIELISGAPGGAAIDVPVRAGTANDDGGDLWTDASYLQGADGGGIAYYAQTIEDGVGLDTEAQVAGLPHRNPPIIDGAYSPYPNAGLLKYPCVNYSTIDYRPSDNIAYADISAPQFNYDSCTGTRYYVRCFDTSFLHHPVYAQVSTGISAPGQSQVVVRIDGLRLADFMYSGAPNLNVVISAKIPGITAWLDIGRYDNATPLGDGNGCKYGTEANPSAYTIDGQDPQTRIWYSQVHLEMTNDLFINSVDGMVPLLIQVALKSTLATEHMDLEWAGAADNPDASSANIRGIVGIRIIHPSEL